MLPLPPLYPITDARLPLSLSDQIRRLGQAGFPLVQFRGKGLDLRTQWAELRRALLEAREAGGWPHIVVNDRADLAVLAAQEGLTPWGLHLGQDDLPPSEARRLPGLGGVHIGTSTHEPREWTDLDPACDHAGAGPFRATQTKGDHAEPIGLEGLAHGARLLRARGLPTVAIGGLTLADAGACFEAGAESLAMIGEVARSMAPAELLWEAQVQRWRVRPPVVAGQGIVLAGGSGCGKSTLARVLGQRTGLPVVDLDDHIEAKAGRRIPEIFDTEGEAAFRDLEAHCVGEVLAQPAVVALGGGAWERAEVRERVGASGFATLWLAEVPERAWARVAGDPGRPLAAEQASFLARHRTRMARWSELPVVLPLGRSAEALAEALIVKVGEASPMDL